MQQNGPRAWPVALAGMMALASAMGIGRFVYTPILPSMIEALGLSASAAGLIASANYAGYLVGALMLVKPERLPGRRADWVLGALGLGAVASAGMAAASGLVGFMALRFVGGVASAVVIVLSSGLVLGRLNLMRAGRLGALHFAGVGVGIALSAVIVTALEWGGVGWPGLWLGAGVASLALAGGVAAWLPREGVASVKPVAVAGRSGGRFGLVSLAACYGLFGFGYVVTATFLVAAVRASPVTRPIEPLIWLLVGLAGVPSVAGWAWVESRIGARQALGVACLVEAVGVAVGSVWEGPGGALTAAVLLGGTIMGITSLAFVVARGLVPPDGLDRAFAIITVAFGVGQVVGPVVAGVMADRTGSLVAPTLLAAVALAAAASLALRPGTRSQVPR